MNQNQEKLRVDVRKVVQSKAPEKAGHIPGFVYKVLERIIHQDEVNEILERYGDREGVSFASGVLEYLGARVESQGLDKVPPSAKPYIFVSNHPLGGLDGLALIHEIGSHYGNALFVVNDLLMFLKPLQCVFVPVNKHGRQSVEYARRIDEAYSGPYPIIYFPAGLCSRRINGRIMDLPWKKNVVQKAIQYQRDIVPVYFAGKNTNAFYRLAKWRKRLNIKFNIEMLFLPHELFKKNNAKFEVLFGCPITVEQLRQGHPADWALKLQNIVYSLPQNNS